MHKLILLGQGLSEWNIQNRFTGWHDVDLADEGIAESRKAGQALRDAGLQFDTAYTSLLKRAIRTLWKVLDQLDQMWIPVVRDWRLNERHYGALQGLNKAETAAKHGEDQVLIWRRSYDTSPPPVSEEDDRFPGNDPRYAGDEEIIELNIPTGIPLVYELDSDLKRVGHYYLADEDKLKDAMAEAATITKRSNMPTG